MWTRMRFAVPITVRITLSVAARWGVVEQAYSATVGLSVAAITEGNEKRLCRLGNLEATFRPTVVVRN